MCTWKVSNLNLEEFYNEHNIKLMPKYKVISAIIFYNLS